MWRSEYRSGCCVVLTPSIENAWELDEGQPRLAGLEEPLQCKFNEDYPRDIQLTDNLFGTSVPIVSVEAKTALTKLTATSIEFLPVDVFNHKGRHVNREYFVLHPLTVCECINLSASGVEWNRIDPSQASAFEGVVVDEQKIPDDCNIFRPKFSGHNIVLSGDLAESLTTMRLTGLVFREFAGYKGIG